MDEEHAEDHVEERPFLTWDLLPADVFAPVRECIYQLQAEHLISTIVKYL